MMQPIEIRKGLFQLFLTLPRDGNIALLPCVLVQKPHDASPEPICPPVKPVICIPVFRAVTAVVIAAVFIRRVRNPVFILFTHPADFFPDSYNRIRDPLLFLILHTLPPIQRGASPYSYHIRFDTPQAMTYTVIS